jgi:hypothetical protein
LIISINLTSQNAYPSAVWGHAINQPHSWRIDMAGMGQFGQQSKTNQNGHAGH